MNEQSFQPAKDVIDRFTILKRQSEEIAVELFKTVINERNIREHNAGSFLPTVSSIISVNEELLGQYQSLKARYNEENRLYYSAN